MRKLHKFAITFLLIFVIGFGLSFDVRAALYVHIETQSGELSGEYLESYEDRWFYEESTKNTERYILLFDKKGNQLGDKSQFHMIPKNEIIRVMLLSFKKSTYKEFLRRNNLFFKNHLVENAHVLTGNEGHHKFEKMFGNFAWDIGIIDVFESQFKGNGHHLEDYYIFDKEVISPLKGVVIGKVDGQIDNPPDLSFSGDLSDKINNFLTIQVHPLVYLSVVHFKKNTIEVEV